MIKLLVILFIIETFFAPTLRVNKVNLGVKDGICIVLEFGLLFCYFGEIPSNSTLEADGISVIAYILRINGANFNKKRVV